MAGIDLIPRPLPPIPTACGVECVGISNLVTFLNSIPPYYPKFNTTPRFRPLNC